MYTEILLFATVFLLGLRHGFDWDHLAAIGDIVTTQPRSKTAIILGTLYALGHAAAEGLGCKRAGKQRKGAR